MWAVAKLCRRAQRQAAARSRTYPGIVCALILTNIAIPCWILFGPSLNDPSTQPVLFTRSSSTESAPLQGAPGKKHNIHKRGEKKHAQCTLPPGLNLINVVNKSQWFRDLLQGPPVQISLWSDEDMKLLSGHGTADAKDDMSEIWRLQLLSVLTQDQATSVKLLLKKRFCKEQDPSGHKPLKRVLGLVSNATKLTFHDHFGLQTFLDHLGTLKVVIDIVRSQCVLVGPSYFREFLRGSYLDCSQAVEFPARKNATEWNVTRAVRKVQKAASKMNADRVYVLVSAEMGTKQLLQELYHGLDARHTVLEVGDSLEMFSRAARQHMIGKHLDTFCKHYAEWFPSCVDKATGAARGATSNETDDEASLAVLPGPTGTEESFCMETTLKLPRSLTGGYRPTKKLKAVLDLIQWSRNLTGDIVEAGVGDGASCLPSLYYMACTGEIRHRKLRLFDTWKGNPEPLRPEDRGFVAGDHSKSREALHFNGKIFGDYYLAGVLQNPGKPASAVTWEQAWKHIREYKGLFAKTMRPALKDKRVAVLICDGEMYESTLDCLKGGEDSVVKGGWVYEDDYYTFSGTYLALRHYLAKMTRAISSITMVPQAGKRTRVLEDPDHCKPPVINDPDKKQAGRCWDKAYEAAYFQVLGD